MELPLGAAQKKPGERLPFEIEGEFAAFEFSGDALAFDGPVKAQGFMIGIGEDITLEGQIEAALLGTCARCLRPARIVLRIPFVELFSRQPSDEHPDAFLFEGARADIGEMVLANLFMSLPMQLLCREDCKGLCPACGKDRNLEPCGCAKSGADSPFAALQNLLKDEK
ncbi:MAG: DUF177 domain-containing protein [Christensenellaceae bacterium]|jgi:uncharacterized protein|nr:DUF177 domain-containing protein [Christensenellaceae bacterium]